MLFTIDVHVTLQTIFEIFIVFWNTWRKNIFSTILYNTKIYYTILVQFGKLSKSNTIFLNFKNSFTIL